MALWVVILVMILLLVTMLRQGPETPPNDIDYSDFLEADREWSRSRRSPSKRAP